MAEGVQFCLTHFRFSCEGCRNRPISEEELALDRMCDPLGFVVDRKEEFVNALIDFLDARERRQARLRCIDEDG